MTPSEKPVVFISHRTRDYAIARRLTEALRVIFGDSIDVYNTTDKGTKRPQPGDQIYDKIQAAIHRSVLVWLLYTAPEEDWAWCFHEAGLAIDPSRSSSTQVTVFNLHGPKPPVFDGALQIVVTGDNFRLDHDEGADLIAQHLIDLVSRSELLGTGTDLLAPDLVVLEPEARDQRIRQIASDLATDLRKMSPAAEQELAKTLLTTLRSLPAQDRADRFAPVIQGASSALSWGLTSEPAVRDLFVKFWNNKFSKDLSELADRRLVFTPGRVSEDWNSLLKVLIELMEADPQRAAGLNRPVLALASSEADPVEFWEQARDESADAYYYEEPVRKLSETLTRSIGAKVAHPIVVRRISVGRGYLEKPTLTVARERAERLADVIVWMNDADIAVELISRAPSPTDDYGIVGDLAVSRFENLGDTDYRTLVEDFSEKAMREARESWGKRTARLRSADEPISASDILERFRQGNSKRSSSKGRSGSASPKERPPSSPSKRQAKGRTTKKQSAKKQATSKQAAKKQATSKQTAKKQPAKKRTGT